MGEKGKVTLYIDLDVIQTAREIGLNISKVSENALKDAIKRLQTSVQQNEPTKTFRGKASFLKKVCGAAAGI